ncbi:predicted protein [Postia placenta Mad-698-R]|nr:predicted protein [Postia placenta Mad-698-R]
MCFGVICDIKHHTNNSEAHQFGGLPWHLDTHTWSAPGESWERICRRVVATHRAHFTSDPRSVIYLERIPVSPIFQLYTRKDVTRSQRAAVVTLTKFLISSSQLAQELDFEPCIEELIARVLGETSNLWEHIPPRRGHDIDVSHAPLVAVVSVESNLDPPCADHPARPLMTKALHRTLELLLEYHYAQHGWSLDHIFTKEDAELQLEEHLFAFSVFYDPDRFAVYVNYPNIELHGEICSLSSSMRMYFDVS